MMKTNQFFVTYLSSKAYSKPEIRNNNMLL